MLIRLRSFFATAFGLIIAIAFAPRTFAAEDQAVAEVRAATEQMVAAINAGKADEVAAQFAPQGELIDDEGEIFQGTKELTEVFKKYFQRFPGAKLKLDIESIRIVGPNLAIEEGTRYITSVDKEKGDVAKAQLRYSSVRMKANGKWQIASLREFADDPAPTPHERLASLAWLVGDWVNEGSDNVVKISYRWSEDGNYLLGDYVVTREDKATRKSSHRIGWDPQANKVHSWLFDSDGGFSEGQWTLVDDDWVIKSSSVNPDGQAATATLTVSQTDKDHFTMKGTDRIVGDSKEPDFDLTIARKPPAPKK